MAAFGIGTATGLLLFQDTLRRVLAPLLAGRRSIAAGAMGLRVSGLLLAVMAAVALVAAVAGRANPFCS
jgi:hypothetical protein